MPQTTMVELLVRVDCQGCERTIRKALSKVKGVESVDVDHEQQKVTVSGYVDPMKVLRRVRRAGKAAELWNPCHLHHYPLSYVHTPLAFSKTYNYYTHGFNTTSTTSYHDYPSSSFIHSSHSDSEEEQYGSLDTHPNAFMFSDDNPNACSIM